VPEAEPDVTEINDLSALRALADPLRMRVLELLSEQPRSVKDLAAVLAEPRNKLHYHINVLAKHGLVRVASTRRVGPVDERCYERTTRLIRAAPVAPLSASQAETIAGKLARAAADVDELLQHPNDGRLAVGSVRVHVTDEQYGALVRRLHALVEEYAEPAAGTSPSEFVFAVYS
jgi:DNA-binding transcriptional ArsR family regulator